MNHALRANAHGTEIRRWPNGLLLLRRKAPLKRRSVAYFCSGAHSYQGQTEVIHAVTPQAQDMTSHRVKSKAGVDEEQKRKNLTKAKVRSKVEWPFRILKRVFGFVKVRYCGLKKNHEWLLAAFALVNLYQHRKHLAVTAA